MKAYLSEHLPIVALICIIGLGLVAFVTFKLLSNSPSIKSSKILGAAIKPTEAKKPTPTSTPTPTLTPAPTNTPIPTKTPTPTATSTPTPSPTLTPTPTAQIDDIWEKLAVCESGGNWSLDTGNGYYGGLQFSQETWNSVGGTGNPAHASREEQINRGKMLQERSGWSVWGECAVRLGLN